MPANTSPRKLSRRQDPSHKIMKIRLSAGGSAEKCPCCTRPVNAPSRRILGGKVVEGCVDASHTGHLHGTLEEWHWRQAAIRIRRETFSALHTV